MTLEFRTLSPDRLPWHLLLDADPSRTQVEGYLARGTCVGAFAAATGRGPGGADPNRPLGVALTLPLSPAVYELVNLAVEPSARRQGVGRALVEDSIARVTAAGARRLLVGTGTTSFGPLALYQKAGFRPASLRRDFFLNHFDEPLDEDGIPLMDMIVLAHHLDRTDPRRRLVSPWVTLEPVAPRHLGDLWSAVENDGAGRGGEGTFHHLFFGPFADRAGLERWIGTEGSAADRDTYAILPTRQGKPVGTVSIINEDPSGSAEIGSIWCVTSVNGTPVRGTEVVPAVTHLLLDHLFDFCRYRRVVWKCDATNTASRRAAEAMGFSFEGVHRSHLTIKGRIRDTAWFSMLRDEWSERSPRLLERVADRAARV